MKKNLNIAYLNGAEGIRRCSASSGGSSGGEGNQIEYYDVNMEFIMDEQGPHLINGDFLAHADRAIVNYDGIPTLVGGGEGMRMWLQKEIANEDVLRVSFSKEPIYIFNEGSWKANYRIYLKEEGMYEHDIEVYLNRFTSITKEEFYNLEV